MIRCGHLFCFECINEWSTKTNNCPICKKKFNIIKEIGKHRESNKVVESKIIESDDDDYIDPALFG